MKGKIKIFMLAALFMLTATAAYGQKCKFDSQSRDPITGEDTKGSTFSVQYWWSLGFNKNGNNYHIGMLAIISGNVRDVIMPENTLIFKLANDEIITLNANDNYVPTAQATTNGVISSYNARFDISEEDLQKIASSPLAHVRMTIGPQTFDRSITARKGMDFQNQARCIML